VKGLFHFVGPRLGRLVELPDGGSAPVRHAPAVPVREIVRRFWPYARPYRYWLCPSLVLILLVPLIEAAQIWMFKLVIDEVLVPKDFGPFLWIAAAYLTLAILGGVVSFANDYLSAWIGESFLLSLRTSLFRHIQGLSLDFFARRRLGDVLARLTGDVSAIETFVLSGVTQALAYAAQIAIFAGLLSYLQWELALIALVVVPLVWLAARYFTRLVKQASREKRRRRGSLSAVAPAKPSAERWDRPSRSARTGPRGATPTRSRWTSTTPSSSTTPPSWASSTAGRPLSSRPTPRASSSAPRGRTPTPGTTPGAPRTLRMDRVAAACGASRRGRPPGAHRPWAFPGTHRGVHRTRVPGIPGTPDPPNHAGFRAAPWVQMGGTGLEPVTPSLSSWCSPN